MLAQRQPFLCLLLRLECCQMCQLRSKADRGAHGDLQHLLPLAFGHHQGLHQPHGDDGHDRDHGHGRDHGRDHGCGLQCQALPSLSVRLDHIQI